MKIDKKNEKIELNELSIIEFRRIYGDVSELFKQVRIRNLTYLGAEFALLSYLYINNGQEKNGILEKLFVPKEPYGMIFYIIAFGSCLVSLVLLILAMQTVQWRSPTDIEKIQSLNFKSKLEYLEYTKNEYAEALKIDIGHCEKKQALVSSASYLLIFGGVLLIVIKNF